MAQSQTIKEFLVGLKFDVDARSESKFQAALDTAKNAVAALAGAFATYKIVDYIRQTIAAFDSLYWSSIKLSSSASGLQKFDYAMRQLGESAETGRSSLAGLAQLMRERPEGMTAWLKGLNVQTKDAAGNLRSIDEVVVDLGKSLRSRMAAGKLSYYAAARTAEIGGVNEETFRLIIKPEFAQNYDDRKAIQKMFGVDPDKLAKDSARISNSMRKLLTIFESVWDRFVELLTPFIDDVLKWIVSWIQSHSAEIKAFFDAVKGYLNDFLKWAKEFDWKKFWTEFRADVSALVTTLGNLWEVIKKGLQWFGLMPTAANAAPSAGGAGGGGGVNAAPGGGAIDNTSFAGGNAGRGQYNVKAAYDLLKRNGATDTEARVLAAISQPESDGDPRARNPYGRDYSIGLWQINMLAHKTRFGTEEQLKDPDTNARAAIALARGKAGFRNWTTFTSGKYLKYLQPLEQLNRPETTSSTAPGAAKIQKAVKTLSNIVDAANDLHERYGVRISEHPAFGGVHPVHHGRGHYEGRAVDINAPGHVHEATDPEWGAKFDQIAREKRAEGFKVIWRQKGHFDHLHLETPIGFQPKTHVSSGATDNSRTVTNTQNITIHGSSDPQAMMHELRRAGSMVANSIVRNNSGKAQ